MKGLKTEFYVGVFTLVVLAILSFMTFKVRDLRWFKKPGYTVYVYFKNTSGLDEKTKVKIAGVDAGTIEKIELEEGRAKLTVSMYPQIKLYSDTSASIRATGLLGDKYLELKSGEKEPFLNDGDHIANVEEMADIDDLVKKITELASELGEIAGDKELKDALKESVMNIKDITANLKETISTSDAKLQTILTRVDSLTASLDELIKANRIPITNAISNIETFSASLKDEGKTLVSNLNQTSAELRDMIKKSRPDVESITNSVNVITQKVEKGEGTLGKLVMDEKLYSSVSNAVGGIERTIAGIDRFKTFITLYGDYMPDIADGKSYAYITLQPRPNKYYILGVVDDPIGSVESEQRTVDGVTITEKKLKAKIEFTAQFAQRFRDTLLRAGLTENTFGIGADQFFLNDKVKLSADAWDFRRLEHEAETPHVRLGADYFVFKRVFLTGGVDNVFNSHAQYPFFGGGVRFEDEDFKYLFSWIPIP